MEKNIHDDRLDDFVKKSFEDYEENPATNMWERIEGQIPAEQDRRPAWYAWRGYRWQLAAATVILLLVSRLVCIQLYYEEKLRTISGQQEQAYQNVQTTAPKVTDATEKPSNENSSAANSHDAKSIQTPLEVKQTEIKAQINPSQKTAQTGVSTTNHSVVKKEITEASSAETKAYTPAIIIDKTGLTDDSLVAQTNAVIAPQPFARQGDFQILNPKNEPLAFARHDHPYQIDIPVKKYKERSGWYAGIFVSPHLIVEKTETPKRPGPGNPRHLYANQQQRPQVSAEVWLRVGKKINTRFAIESGLGFQQLTRTSVHRPRFEYREGNPIQPSGGAESRSFDYDLNTYGGSASVSLRTEVDGNDTPTATERVGAIISCREQIQLLQIPVLGVARFGQSRVQAVIKAGVLGNYLTKNKIQISASTLENAKLRLRGNDGYSVQYNRPQHLILGYQASAGVEFRVNKNLSIAAAPTLSGDFPRTDSLRGKLPGHTAFGLNVGANWWF